MSDAPSILNVNDHEPTRYLVTRHLERGGFHVTEAASGEEALTLASSRHLDVVVLDVMLPDLSDLEVCRMLKSRRETAGIFVLQTSVQTSAFTDAARRVAGLDSGADAYLAHPFEAAELNATVNALVRLKTAEDTLRMRAKLLDESNHKKDEFLAMLAHELRNPLAAIATGVELLELVHADAAQFTRTRDMLRRQSRHLAALIDDLLDVSRIIHDRIELRRERCDVRTVVGEVLTAHGTVASARGQRVIVDLPKGLYVSGDPTRLHQVMLNLFDNASKYTREGGTIRVCAERCSKAGAGPFAVVTVADDGVGMSAEFLPHAFDAFVQADKSLHRTSGGLGVGLTMVKRLVALHGGEVHASSDGVGKGSTFSVWLPLLTDSVRADPMSASSAASPPAR